MKKRLISMMLALFLLLSFTPSGLLFPPALAADGAVLSVDSVYGSPGDSVDVNIRIRNNPGILGATLKLSFDPRLTLQNVTQGAAFASVMVMTPPGVLATPCTIVFDGMAFTDANLQNDVLVTLSFLVPEGAGNGDAFSVALSTDSELSNRYANPISYSVENGRITALTYIPGDVNSDGKVKVGDVTSLRRFIAGGYGVTINEAAGDVNADGKQSSSDLILLRQFIAGGYTNEEGKPVTLLPSLPHVHTLEAAAYLAPECTVAGHIAYWYCASCGKYFRDAAAAEEVAQADTVLPAPGHTYVTDAAVPATETTSGLTEGSHCSVCGEVFKQQEVIPALSANQYNITYVVDRNDRYLAGLNAAGEISNSNPIRYSSETGLDNLDDLVVTGYNFEGWFTTQSGGTPVTRIDPGTTGNITLYAHWTKENYTVTFDSPLVPRESISRTIDERTPITDLVELSKYKFMGWTDDDGNVVTMLEPGTENVTLHANWISYRKQTISNDYIQKGPVVIEDEENARYLFVFDIGKIINVPLYVIKDFGNTTSGMTVTVTDSKTSAISNTTAESITRSIVEATTNSATWTMTKDWNQLVTNTEDFSETELQENSIAISDGWVHTEGDVTETGTVTDTGTVTRDNTVTRAMNKAGGSIEGSFGWGRDTEGLAKLSPVSASVKVNGHYDREWGTDTTKETTTNNLTKTNDLNSHTSSTDTSHNETATNRISNSATKAWGYSLSNSTGGSEGESTTVGHSISDSNTYATSFSYTTQETETTVREYSTSQCEPGWHRLVCAGTVHVFAVVGFDIATRTYFYYTQSFLDDETYEFYDYCATNGEYNDYETGVLPFAVPISVHDYISEHEYSSDGIIVDPEGIVIRYTGSSQYVVIPDHYRSDNGDGTFSAVPITGISSSAFAGKDIKAIRLSRFIREIPAGAFQNCSQLEFFEHDELTKIGANAFAGCTSLRPFTVGESVDALDPGAFTGVGEVTVEVYHPEIAAAAAASGAKILTLNLRLDASEMSGQRLSVGAETESFTLNGFRRIYRDLEVRSESASTTLNGLTFTSNSGTPITLSSSAVLLENVSVTDTSSLALLLKAGTTALTVNGVCTLDSGDSIGALTKGLSITQKSGSTQYTSLVLPAGSLYVCGPRLSAAELELISGEVEYLSETDYDNILNTRILRFDCAGGNVGGVESFEKPVRWNAVIGELPVPEKAGYSFDGWYLENGTRVTKDSTFSWTSDQTVYAHWSANGYTVSWQNPANCTITVSRTASPNVGAATGVLSSGDTVYLGDVLKVTYSPATGYSIKTRGQQDITVESDVTSAMIYATTSVNSYTYSILYRSTNGTDLGSTTARYAYGTTNRITAPAKSGYQTPSAKNVTWDTAGSKTVTFYYTPSSVSQYSVNGSVQDNPYVGFHAWVETQARTANSIQVRVGWTNTIQANGYIVYSFNFETSINGQNPGAVTVTPVGTWNNSVSYERSQTNYSGWVTVPVSATTTSVSVYVHHYQCNYNGTNMSDGGSDYTSTWTVPIPTY